MKKWMHKKQMEIFLFYYYLKWSLIVAQSYELAAEAEEKNESSLISEKVKVRRFCISVEKIEFTVL